MKKIVHIDSQLSIIGGMERYIEEFYLCFSEAFDISVLGFQKSPSKLQVPESKTYSFDEKNDNRVFSKLKKLFSRSKKINQFCHQHKIDICISHGDIANIFNVLSKIFGNPAKIILVVHSNVEKKSLGFVPYILAKILYRYADSIVCVSQELSKNIENTLYVQNIHTIYNPFFFPQIHNAKNEGVETNLLQILQNEKTNFCHISRLEENKNTPKLIQLFSKFALENENCQLIIIGEGSLRKSLEQGVSESGLSGQIFFFGEQENVYKYLKYIDYFICHFLSEGFGRVLVDALSLGIPVLSNDYPFGAKEIIRDVYHPEPCKDIEIHENGILVPYMSDRLFIEGLTQIQKTVFAKENIQKNIRPYAREIFAESWINLLP